ncbi:MAG: SH3 domain-containing protein [Nitrosomonadales bacterium]
MLKKKLIANAFFAIYLYFNITIAAAEFMSVASKQAAFHEAPSDSTKKIFIATEGYPVDVLVSLKEWKKVKDHEGKISWIKAEDLSKKRTVLAKSEDISFYQQPNTTSAILGKVSNNVVLDLVDDSAPQGWIKVYSKAADLEGYVETTSFWGSN